MSTHDELQPQADAPGTRGGETVPAGTGSAGSFDSRHGEFTDGQPGAGIDPGTGRPAHGDGIEHEEPERAADDQEAQDGEAGDRDAGAQPVRDDQQRYLDQLRGEAVED